ncbi:glycosyltransferase family 2 protein [Ruegeria marina]|uniref:Galactosyltransferase n=1 Tax=Ruegeria marina TaxID=639004 RepID=A0A1G7E6W0_9RHOB|nr:glycosyltransferase family 2 protein [Ruegeria marina]SDE59431.1 Galactosyltransferase [Ruegeria marina]
MLTFSALTPARFAYRADFSHDPFANISFFDAAREEILFHLSLRAEEGLAVCNRRGAALADWHREIPRRVRLGRQALVEIAFAVPRLAVRLDGQEIFTFGGPLRRGRFPDLAGIAQVDFQGGLIPASLDMDVSHPGVDRGRLHLNGRLELRAPRPAGATGFRLEIPETGSDFPIFPDLPGTGLRAALPGRIWAGLDAGVPLRVRLLADGRAVDEIVLTPEDLLARVVPLLSRPGLAGDPGLAALVAEHLRFAGLEARFDPLARSGLARLGGALGFARFLQSGGGAATAPAPAPVPDNAGAEVALIAAKAEAEAEAALTAAKAEAEAEAALTTALAAAAPALRALEPGGDPARALAALAPPPGKGRLYFYIALTEPFCLKGCFDALRDHALATGATGEAGGGLEGLEPSPDDAWFNSGLLPWLLRADRAETLRDVMWRLENARKGWIMTPPLAWAVAQTLAARTLNEKTREEILYSFLHFLRKRGARYWERTSCVALIGTALDLLEARDSLSDYMRKDLERILLQVYGLSRPFWDMVAARDIALPPALAAARDGFAALDDGAATPAVREAALRLFDQADCAEAPRIRRDLFGPSGVAGEAGGAPDAAALARTGLDIGEAALRHLAAPGGALPPVLADAARLALPGCYTRVPRAPYAGVQERAARTAAVLLAQARTGTDPVDGLAPLLPDLMVLSGRRSQQLGLGLGVALLAGLRQTGATGAADWLEWALADMLRELTTNARVTSAAPRLELDPVTGQPRRLRPGEEAPELDLEPVPSLTDLARAPAVAQPLRRLHPAPDSPLAGLAAAARSAALPAPHPALPEDNPLFDTLVTVFSCKPNLATRIPALRAAWLARLAELGVPYVIVTGDGDGTLSGDVLALDAPDDYEGLPQKTLATIAWVRANTGFAHMFKIDDDCFLNADAFFHGLSYRKADYYGRTLTRGVGQMDRAWHTLKSGSDRGRFELDKSPEPSAYCDGGSGYALSRTAMEAALAAAASPEGQALIGASFMEDKLLGDLLSLAGIRPENTDYRIAVRRREAPGGRTVARWENGFYPSRANPVALIHLDDAADQATAAAALASDALIPNKIWPSYQPARLGADSNALEMITGPERLVAAREAPVAVVACMRNEMFMLPSFLAHYRRLGVESFLIADNCSDDGTLEYLAEQPDVALFSVDTAYSKSRYGVAWQQALMANLRPNRWSLVADADELLVWEREPRQTLPGLLGQDAFAAADAVRVFMLDLYPEGSLSEATFASGDPFSETGHTDRMPFLETSYGRGPYSDSPTWTSAVRHRLIPGSRAELFVAQKMALLKYSPFMRLSAGLHYVSGTRPAARELIFGHFKYNADFRRKAQAEVARGQHFNDAEEYRKYLALVSEGRDVIFDADVSVPWQDCAFVKARLG